MAAVAFLLGAAAIAGGVLVEAREARLQALLLEIETAEERIPYVGVRALEGPGWSVVLEVASAGGRRRTKLLNFSGPGIPVTGKATGRIPFLARFPEFLRPGHGWWSRKIKDYDLALRNYDFRPAGRDSVAGREADLLEVRARYRGRADYRVAFDAANRFPLRFEALGGGRPIFRAEFRSVDYREEAGVAEADRLRLPSWLRIERDEIPAAEIPPRVDYEDWVPARLPAGFERRRSALVRVGVDLPEEVRRGVERLFFQVPRLDARVAHFDYTDGIAVLSMVQCPARSELWRLVRGILGGGEGQEGGRVVARRFSDPWGAAFFLEIGGTAILAAGNVGADLIEEMIRTLQRR